MGELFPLENVLAVLEEYAREVTESYRARLLADDRRASGELIDSVTCQVVTRTGGWDVTLTLRDYWKYVEYGTRPHWPPREAILRWIRMKPVIPRPGADGRVPTERQLAFLIARKISRVGTEGRPSLRRTLEELNAIYLPRLESALAEDAGEYVRRVMTAAY